MSRRPTRTATAILAFALLASACGGASVDRQRLCDIADDFSALPDIVEVAPEESLEALATARRLLDESVDVAPDEIRPAIELVRDGRQVFFDLIEEAGGDLSAVSEVAVDEAIDAAFLARAIAEADREWDIWKSNNCG